MTHNLEESGVAEILGSLMLIAIIGLGVAIAGVYLLNHSVPEKIPEFRASLANTSTSLTLHHDGGESIPRSSFIILVNGNPTNYVSSNASSQDWSIDETLTFYSYDPSTPLPDVKIVYNGSAGERVLADFSSNIPYVVPTHTAIPTTPPTTIPTPTPTLTTYTVTSSAGTGGSISPSGIVIVSSGATPTYTITPNAGYYVADVLVNGGSVGGVTTYTFSPVTSDQTIPSTFTTTNLLSIDALDPDYAVAGDPALVISILGTGFTPSSIGKWNGVARPTTYVAPDELTISISTSDLASAGTDLCYCRGWCSNFEHGNIHNLREFLYHHCISGDRREYISHGHKNS